MKEIDLWPVFREVIKQEKSQSGFSYLELAREIIFFFILAAIVLGFNWFILSLLIKSFFLILLITLPVWILLYILMRWFRNRELPEKNCIGKETDHILKVDLVIRRQKYGSFCEAVASLKDSNEYQFLVREWGNPRLILPVKKRGNCLEAIVHTIAQPRYELYIRKDEKIDEVFVGDNDGPWARLYRDVNGRLFLDVRLDKARAVRIEIDGKKVVEIHESGTYQIELVDTVNEETRIILPDPATVRRTFFPLTVPCHVYKIPIEKLYRELVSEPWKKITAVNVPLLAKIVLDIPYAIDKYTFFYVKVIPPSEQ